MTSPARTRTVHLSASFVARDSSPPGSSQFSPDAPLSPPSTPHGRDTRRSVISDTVASSSTSRSRSMPSPPRAAPSPPDPRPQPTPHDPHRIRLLERLDRRVAGVRHACVHTAHAVAARSCPLSAGERLVVHPAVAPDDQVVHRSLRRGAESARRGERERTEAHVGDPLAHLDVPGTDRCRRPSGDDRPRRRDDLHRTQRAAVGRNRRIGGDSQSERDRRDRDRLDRVHVAGALRVGTREVERDAITGHSDGDHDARQHVADRRPHRSSR